MKTLKYCLVLLVLAMTLYGCAEKQQIKSKEIKFCDLLPKKTGFAGEKGAVSFAISIFEMDMDKYQQILGELRTANDLKIKYEDSENFTANGLICGGGDINTWSRIVKNLADANAAIVKQTTFFMDLNNCEDIEVAQFSESASISYCTADKAWSVVGFPQGVIVLNICAKSLLGLRESCKLEIKPVYKVVEGRKFGWDFSFDSAAVSAAVQQGRFIFLAPDTECVDESIHQAGHVPGKLIFCREKGRAVARFCLIVCGAIRY